MSTCPSRRTLPWFAVLVLGGLASSTRAADPAIVPGKAAESDLVARIGSDDPAKRMPPSKTGKRLTTAQIELLRRWIDEGANWPTHWAFVPPRQPALPKVRQADWPRNAIDYFI